MAILKSSVKVPFDPSSIKAEVKNTTIGFLIDMMKNGIIDLEPEFQRNGNLWGIDQQSQLIESILLGLPLPSFYFYIDKVKKKWVVIDGLQRLSSLNNFIIKKSFLLKDLEFIDKEKYHKRYDEFDYFDQVAISMFPVTLNILNGDAPAEARYIIFQRVNSKGTALKPAEIRNALYQGMATDMINRMTNLSIFKETVSNFISTKRMMDKEYASHFLALSLNGGETANWDKLDVFISQTLDKINQQVDQQTSEEIISNFDSTLQLCKELLGVECFRKPTEPGNRKNQISLSIFGMLTVNIANLTYLQRRLLLIRKDAFVSGYMSLFRDALLQKYLSGGTGKMKTVHYRLSKVQELIETVLI